MEKLDISEEIMEPSISINSVEGVTVPNKEKRKEPRFSIQEGTREGSALAEVSKY